MIHNTGAGTFHPVIFAESPLPGSPDPDKPVRHKSRGHHTDGFPTREEALANIDAEMMPGLKEHGIGTPGTCLDEEFTVEWDGKGVPADVAYFQKKEGQDEGAEVFEYRRVM